MSSRLPCSPRRHPSNFESFRWLSEASLGTPAIFDEIDPGRDTGLATPIAYRFSTSLRTAPASQDKQSTATEFIDCPPLFSDSNFPAVPLNFLETNSPVIKRIQIQPLGIHCAPSAFPFSTHRYLFPSPPARAWLQLLIPPIPGYVFFRTPPPQGPSPGQIISGKTVVAMTA